MSDIKTRMEKLQTSDDVVVVKTFFMKLSDIWKDNTYIFDVPSFVMVIFASIYLTFFASNIALNNNNQALITASSIASTLLLFGLVFYIFLFIAYKKDAIRPTFQDKVTTEDAQITVIFVAIFFIIEYAIQTLISTITLSTIELEGYMFYVSMAIAETIIFSCMFQITFEAITKQPIVGILMHAGFFVLYHMNVYGTNSNELIAVFFSGLVFAIAIKMTKRLSVAMIIHIIINLLASGVLAQLG